MPDLDHKIGRRACNHHHCFMSHTAYWSLDEGTEYEKENDPETVKDLQAHHIQALRKALGLGRT